LKGRYSWNRRTASDLQTAISYFNQAIAKDNGYALAYSGLADVYSVLESYGGIPSEIYPKSNAAARKALELDPTLAHPHAVLGNNIWDGWDFAAGEAEFKKAFELDPDDATAHQWYAEGLSNTPSRQHEALAEIDRAHQLDPLSPIISTVLGFIHYQSRDYDDAIAVYKKVIKENPIFAMAHDSLSDAYWGKHMYAQVIEEYKVFGELSGDRNESEFASALEQGFRATGWKRALTKGIEVRLEQRKTGYSSPYDIAGLRVDFRLDSLRSDPRFAELVRKVGLPE